MPAAPSSATCWRSSRSRTRSARCTRAPMPTRAVATGLGPVATSLADLPAIPLSGVVIANELLDNLPFRIVERTADGWSEVRVGVDGDTFEEDLVPASDDLAVEADHVAASPRCPIGGSPARADRRRASGSQSCAFVAPARRAHRRRLRGRPRRSWSSGASTDGCARTGPRARRVAARRSRATQDITADVPSSTWSTPRAAPGSSLELECTQAEWLRDLGVDDLVADARARWGERAHIGDLEALRRRSRVTEAAALARSRRPRRAPGLRVPGALSAYSVGFATTVAHAAELHGGHG